MPNTTANIYILSSELGDIERAEQWNAFLLLFNSKCENIEICECKNIDDADFIFLATGGVEGIYKKLYKKGVTPTSFYAPSCTNAFAASNEIRAFLLKNNSTSLFYKADELSLSEFVAVSRIRRLFRKNCIAALGEPAPWLIASIPSDEVVSSRFGAKIIRASWSSLEWPSSAIHPETLGKWTGCNRLNSIDAQEFTNACKLSSKLNAWAKDHSVDAVTVGCFPLLADHVSACLSVADLLDAGIPAACENDICAALAMLMAKHLGFATTQTGALATWMANLVDIDADKITLQHCTIGLNMLKDAHIMTHFESHANVAVAGSLPLQNVTIFRFDDSLTHAFIAEGYIFESSANPCGCRTSAKILLNRHMPTPLGNHHILVFGHHAKLLKAACMLMNMEIV